MTRYTLQDSCYKIRFFGDQKSEYWGIVKGIKISKIKAEVQVVSHSKSRYLEEVRRRFPIGTALTWDIHWMEKL